MSIPVRSFQRTVFVGFDGREYDNETAARDSFLVEALAEFLREHGGSAYDFSANDAASGLLSLLSEGAVEELCMKLVPHAPADGA
jgi:hypothetical protein